MNYNDFDEQHMINVLLHEEPKTDLQRKMKSSIVHIYRVRTEQCWECVNYHCPTIGIPDNDCEVRVKA